MKEFFIKCLVGFRIDALFRLINNRRLLVVCYHNVCAAENGPPLFNHLSVDIFREHLEYLNKHYNIISLNEMSMCLKEKKPFPKKAAMITFDDGFMNIYKFAFPLLKEYNNPATIFLVVDYIGINDLLWFDELFLLIEKALNAGIDLNTIEGIFDQPGLHNCIADIYPVIASKLKRIGYDDRIRLISIFKSKTKVNIDSVPEYFGLLTWDHVKEMKASGLIDFGVHTATHRIVSELPKHEWKREIIKPKAKLSKILACEIKSFCYPNGTPDVDFGVLHEKYLEKAGYLCAFSCKDGLNTLNDNPFRLGRISAGNDMTSEIRYFRLNTSGFFEKVKRFLDYTKKLRFK